MVLIPPQAQISEFWSWFARIASTLGPSFENESALLDLDARIMALDVPGWELGPGLQAENALTLTPDGDAELLPLTERVVSFAPTIPGWEFHAAKPPKDWELQFEIELEDGTLKVDARSWRYVLYRFPDQTFDVVLEQHSFNDVSEDTRYMAATILLDGVLGEAVRLRFIHGVEAIGTLSAELAARAKPVAVLAKHFDSLFERSKGVH